MQTTTVVVRDLTLPFFIGILDCEKQKPQSVTISIDMRVAIADRPSKTAQDFVSYAPIVEYLIGLSEKGDHIDLVEDLADDIFGILFADERIRSARVEILKPEIFAQAAGVGVVMDRENPKYTS